MRKPGDFEAAWARYLSPEHIVIKQHIETTWTKQSRGGTGATARNAVPEARLLPNHAADANRLILHKVAHSELRDFEPVEAIGFPEFFADLQRDGALLIPEEGQLVVLKERQYGIHRRGEPPLTVAFALKPGQWGRISYNTRRACLDTGNWWYEKHVFNIGVFRELTISQFCDTEPDFKFSKVEKLF